MTKGSLKSKVDGDTLDLSLSELSEPPVKELAEIPKAVKLDLSCNKIAVLPDPFCTLTHLVELDLSKNLLRELPQNFGRLNNLQKLDLYANSLTVLPLSMCRMKQLKWLDLKDNPLQPRLRAVAGDCLDAKQCQTCAKKVVTHLQTLASEEEREKQKRLKEQRELEAKQKAQAEKEAERLRLEKKAEKEKKKAENKLKREQQFREKEAKQKNVEGARSQGTEVKKNGKARQVSSKPQKGYCSSLLRLVLSLVLSLTFSLLFVALSLGCAMVIFSFYTNKRPLTREQLEIVLDEVWHVIRRNGLMAYELASNRLHEWSDIVVEWIKAKNWVQLKT
ncbi:leucine-rich repeat-containing protein 59-like [Ornithodoros turicata]|uniref:Putative conserved plasma membrane protein n=1 Tax=Ornithodoros turicata TaxID=34597 RepID=A0A2R5LDN9_9ACAR